MRRKRYIVTKKNAPYIFLLPGIIFFAFFYGYTTIYAFWISVHNVNLLTSTHPFVGFKNFQWILFEDPLFKTVLINTLYYTIGTVTIGTVLALVFALLVDKVTPALKLTVRTIAFLPVVTSLVAAGILWRWMYNPDIGIINYVLSCFGLEPRLWLKSPTEAMPSVIIMSIWKNLGYNMVIFLAGLQGIPEQYYEAAKIDGANALQLLKSITLPLLKPVTLFVIITSMIGSFQVFTQIYVMTEGGPGHATRTIVQYLYDIGFKSYRMGVAAAMAVILMLIILILTVIQIKFSGGFKVEP